MINELNELPNYGTMSKNKRRAHRRKGREYRAFDKILEKIAGSSNPTDHKKFLDSRFYALHHEKENFERLIEKPSWDQVNSILDSLSSVIEGVKYSQQTPKMKSRPIKGLKISALEHWSRNRSQRSIGLVICTINWPVEMRTSKK